jgi:LDH2 family malate/lactate/ureidoglycolate dehydrogenase
MPTLPASALESFASARFVAAGTPADLANVVSHSLVAADLCGHESHGVMRVGRYLERVRNHTLKPAARPVVAKRQNANATVDGGSGFGQVAARFAIQLAIEICHDHGQSGVAIANAHHIGRLGDYAETLAAAGFAGLIMTGGGNRGGSVAPHGGRERIFGTNPIAMAVPTPASHQPLVLDFATSAIPEGRLAVARANHSPVSPGCIVDCNGRPSTNPQDFYAGGALLPFGGHKGSALMLMIEILATTLAGSAPIALPAYDHGNPTLILAWSVDSFVAREIFDAHVGALITRIHTSSAADGVEEVLLPGEIEARTRAKRQREGVPVSAGVWHELSNLGAELGVAVPGIE